MLHILAHRGLWHQPAEKNSLAAMTDAWANGFGIETDVRDCDGQLVISHDPPRRGNLLSLGAVLDAYVKAGASHPLALNIKADGLHQPLVDALQAHGLDRRHYFLFDMAVPDALGYLRRDMPCFTRESEIEPVPAFLDQATGVWLDCFSSDWIDASTMNRHLSAGRSIALVSPELHGRPYLGIWKIWYTIFSALVEQYPHAAIFLCTDHPNTAKDFFHA